MVLQKLNAAGDQFKDAIQNSDYELEKKNIISRSQLACFIS